VFKKMRRIILATVTVFDIVNIAIAQELSLSTATAQDQLEVYVSKVIIQANWGDGPGEFGVYTEAMPIRGPVALDVDRKEDIYIFDPVNWRVVIYNKKGKYKTTINLEKDPKQIIGPYGFQGGYAFSLYTPGDQIHIDLDGNIYIHTEGVRPYMVRKFDKNGKFMLLYIDKVEKGPKE